MIWKPIALPIVVCLALTIVVLYGPLPDRLLWLPVGLIWLAGGVWIGRIQERAKHKGR